MRKPSGDARKRRRTRQKKRFATRDEKRGARTARNKPHRTETQKRQVVYARTVEFQSLE
jgi:hypothetical protein